MNDRDLEMLDAWRHNRLSAEDFVILQERLRVDAELRAALRTLAEIDEGLTAIATARACAPIPTAIQNVSSLSALSVWIPWGVALAACAVAIMAWWWPRDALREGTSPQKSPSAGNVVMAMLVDEADAVFGSTRQPGEVRFDPDHYELISGTVHLRFVNGADLVVEGPALFEIRDEFRIALSAGRVRAIVPPTAHGFTVITDEVSYEDVGTEFGVSVDRATGASQMHVFDGQVNLRRGDAQGSLLRSVYVGDSIGFHDGKLEELPDARVGSFPSPGDIGHLRWVSQRNQRLADPGLIAWFPFEKGGDPSRLVNAVEHHTIPDGRIVGARWATGRWQGKQSLWFDQEGDFVEINIPGQFQELTMAAWLKVERFENEITAILNSDWANPGGIHIQMNRLGLPRGGLLGVGRPNQRWVGNPVPTGKWVHLVSVLSLPERKHTIYVNGTTVLESGIAANDLLMNPGTCRFGNWLPNAQYSKDHVGCKRSLCGLVDELSIWNRALSAGEVEALTESGRPSLLWSRENPPLKVPMPRFPG